MGDNSQHLSEEDKKTIDDAGELLRLLWKPVAWKIANENEKILIDEMGEILLQKNGAWKDYQDCLQHIEKIRAFSNNNKLRILAGQQPTVAAPTQAPLPQAALTAVAAPKVAVPKLMQTPVPDDEIKALLAQIDNKQEFGASLNKLFTPEANKLQHSLTTEQLLQIGRAIANNLGSSTHDDKSYRINAVKLVTANSDENFLKSVSACLTLAKENEEDVNKKRAITEELQYFTAKLSILSKTGTHTPTNPTSILSQRGTMR